MGVYSPVHCLGINQGCVIAECGVLQGFDFPSHHYNQGHQQGYYQQGERYGRSQQHSLRDTYKQVWVIAVNVYMRLRRLRLVRHSVIGLSV